MLIISNLTHSEKSWWLSGRKLLVSSKITSQQKKFLFIRKKVPAQKKYYCWSTKFLVMRYNFHYFLLPERSLFSAAMADPNRLEGQIFEKSPFWGPKFGFFSKDLVDFAPKKHFSESLDGPHRRASRAACGPRAAGWPWLI